MARQLLSSPKGTDPQGNALAVLEFQSPTAALIATPIPRSARYISLLVGTAVIGCLVAATVVKVDKVVTAQGKLVSTVPTQMMQPLQTSIVRNIYVRRGQIVHKGQLLAELDPTFAMADSHADQEQVNSYTAQIERLQAQIGNKPYVPSSANPQSELQLETYNQLQAQYLYGVKNFDQQVAGLQATYEHAQADINQYGKRLELAANVENMRNRLQQMQVGSRLDSLAAADNRLNMAGSLADAQSAAKQALGNIASTVAQRGAFIQQWFSNLSQQLQQASNSLATAQQSLTKDTKVHQLVDLRADQDAMVLTMARVSPGSVLQSGQQFLSLVPLNAPLQAEIDIDGSQSGYVGIGDPVTIKLQSLPFLMYGSIKGHIASVSADSFNQQDVQNGDVPGVTGTSPQTLFYQARVDFDAKELHDTPQNFTLEPGMPVDADVKVGRRTIMEYMMRRILPAFSTGMREPN
jgi:hemolysin D